MFKCHAFSLKENHAQSETKDDSLAFFSLYIEVSVLNHFDPNKPIVILVMHVNEDAKYNYVFLVDNKSMEIGHDN